MKVRVHHSYVFEGAVKRSRDFRNRYDMHDNQRLIQGSGQFKIRSWHAIERFN